VFEPVTSGTHTLRVLNGGVALAGMPVSVAVEKGTEHLCRCVAHSTGYVQRRTALCS
jgi:hypothetical protein